MNTGKSLVSFVPNLQKTASEINRATSMIKNPKAFMDGAVGVQKFTDNLSGMTQASKIATITSQGFTAAQTEMLLTQANIPPAIIASTMATYAQDAANKTVTASTIAFGTAVKSVGAFLKANWLMVAIVGVAAIVKAWDTFAKTAEKAKENLQKLSGELKETTDEIASVNSKLDENAEKIKEINKNPLSIVDKNTLSTLESENRELERQLAVLKLIEKTRREAAEAAALESYNNKDYVNFDNPFDTSDPFSSFSLTLPEEMEANLNLVKEYKKKIENLSMYDIGDPVEEAKRIASYEAVIAAAELRLTGFAEELGNIELNLGDQSEAAIAARAEIIALMEAYIGLEAHSPDMNEFGEVFDAKLTEAQKEELVELAKQGELTADVLAEKFGVAWILWKAQGQTIEGIIEQLKELAKTEPVIPIDPKIQLINDIPEELKEKFSNIDWEKEFTIDEIKILVENTDLEFTGNSVTSIKNAVNSVLYDAAEDAQVVASIDFPELDRAAGYVNNIKSIADAMDDFNNNGVLTIETLSKLQDSLNATDDEINALNKAFETGNIENVKSALEDMIDRYISAKLEVGALSDAELDLMATQLESIGVTDAAGTAIQLVAEAEFRAALATFDFANATESGIAGLTGLASAAGYAAEMIAALETKVKLASDLKRVTDAIGAGYVTVENLMEQAALTRAINQFTLLDFNRAEITDWSKGLGGSGSGGGSNKTAKEVDEYIVEIDRLYLAMKKLTDIQDNMSDLELGLSMANDPKEQIDYINKINDALREEQMQLHEVNNIRDEMIQENVDKLRDLGFDIYLNLDTNKFAVQNMELLNQLFKDLPIEEANKLRKEIEEMIKATDSLNNDSEAFSTKYEESTAKILDNNKKMLDIELKQYTDYIASKNKLSNWGTDNEIAAIKRMQAVVEDYYTRGLIK